MQFTKKRKIMVLVGMFVLLAVTGYLNFALNDTTSEVNNGLQSSASLIATFEQQRDSQRAIEIAHLNSIKESSLASEEQRQEAIEKLDVIHGNMDFETRCESLIKAHFPEAIVSRSNGVVTVILQNPAQITTEQAALVDSIVWEQSGMPANFDWESVFITVIE